MGTKPRKPAPVPEPPSTSSEPCGCGRERRALEKGVQLMMNHSDGKQLRKFGLMVGSIFCAIGLWPAIIRNENPRLWALAIGVALLIPSLIMPRSLGPVYRVWMTAGEALGWINTRILLGVVFYGIITPMGLIMRLLGHDPMRREYEPGVESYRVVKRSRSGAHMTRQF